MREGQDRVCLRDLSIARRPFFIACGHVLAIRQEDG